MVTNRVVLAEDHHIVRDGLRLLLEAQPDIKVVGEAGDGIECLKLVERLQPEILVLDLMLPYMHGLEVIGQIGRYSPNTRTVVLSMYSSESYVLEALRAGASAYVLKASLTQELIIAIREVICGKPYLSARLSEKAIAVYAQKTEPATFDRKNDMLTTREQEVLFWCSHGYTNTEIASWLYISARTVETHRANLMRKLGLRTQAELIRYALDRGILKPDS